MIIWLIFFLFHQTKLNFFPSVCLVPAGHLCYTGFSLCVLTNLSVYPSCLCLCSFCFWEKYSNSWIWNDIGRNCLLGHRKKIAKFLMRIFTSRFTFLFALELSLVIIPSYFFSPEVIPCYNSDVFIHKVQPWASGVIPCNNSYVFIQPWSDPFCYLYIFNQLCSDIYTTMHWSFYYTYRI